MVNQWSMTDVIARDIVRALLNDNQEYASQRLQRAISDYRDNPTFPHDLHASIANQLAEVRIANVRIDYSR